LRLLIRPPQSDCNLVLFTRGNPEGNGYQLADYPRIWVDADAATWNVEQAVLLERFGQNAFPFWEAASHIYSRGIYLPNEQSSDWSQTRRAILHGHARQCIHRFSRLLWESGAHEEAEFRLRTYWIASPRDEDALRLLMKVLAEQERYQEALEYSLSSRISAALIKLTRLTPVNGLFAP
jgi:DNA-binding SARP family transcriptional activator